MDDLSRKEQLFMLKYAVYPAIWHILNTKITKQ